MAQRFGGKYSPGDTQSLEGRRPERVNVFARLLYVAALPVLVAGLMAVAGGSAIEAAIELAAFALLIVGAWLLNEGIKAEQAFAARTIARPPAVPRKILAAGLTAAGVLVAQAANVGVIEGVIFGAITAVAHLMGFGLDPLAAKGIEGVGRAESQRAALAIEEAEAVVVEIRKAAGSVRDREIADRAEALAERARALFRTVEDDPRDLRRARKFLGVYLEGARDATVKYAGLSTELRGGPARGEYLALLTDLEASFATHREVLLADDKTDLDIEIEVLRERLKQEGLEA
ncbi:MAG: 5-bromo-4-chloroindolyl phosphate hydrolysis family protein [Pseudomonadota bacterium]